MQLLPPPLTRHMVLPLAPLYLLLPPLLLTEAGVTSGPRLQWRSVITAPSFPRSQPADCAGSLKSFQIVSGTEVINSIFTKSLKRLKSPQAADVVWVAEGTCCWEVYAGRKHRSTVSSVRNSDGVVRVDHKVKSLKRVPCHR